MKVLGTLALLALAMLAFRGVRWAYMAFVALGLAYFPLSVAFQFTPRACELAFGADLAGVSLTNYPHIALFAVFFLMSSAQLRSPAPLTVKLMWAALATFVMGALVELAQGATGAGNCRARDLIPDGVGILLGATAQIAWHRMRARS